MALVEEIRSWSRRRLAFNVVSLVFALALSALAARHFAEVGWPLAHADPQLAAAAGILFLVAYAFKACGWRRLFVPHERPGSLALAAASGAASIGGAALPGRVDDAIRIAVVRRYPGSRPGVATVCLSLFMLGLIDTVALMPFASTAAVTSEVSIPVRIALAVVAFAGVGAAALVLALPRLVGSRAIARFRAARWLAERAACTREAWKATLLILASWLVRAGGLVLLLGALGVGLSLPLAVAFLTAAAASGALPVAPESSRRAGSRPGRRSPSRSRPRRSSSLRERWSSSSRSPGAAAAG
ncbi:MAG: lysylphosphatidylglycerol synthase domain-containing protein [Actinomycetota bacterium]|nr:lysylphosphatidylglycerol synthase domain-containing protein [Actinomycetota bacterium]